MSKEKLTMKSIPMSERPYEKLEKYGAQTLSDAELLAIVLRSGTSRERVTELACRVLSEMEDGPTQSPLSKLFSTNLKNLMKIHGIGRVKAIQIQAIMEISARLAAAAARERFRAENPESVAAMYMETMRYLTKEIVKVVFLDNKNQYLTEQDISVGSANLSVLNVRDVYAAAMEKNAVNLIVLHNHPSGDPSPSESDLQVTKRLSVSGEMMGIPILDHIIIGNGVYYSMKEQGVL